MCTKKLPLGLPFVGQYTCVQKDFYELVEGMIVSLRSMVITNYTKLYQLYQINPKIMVNMYFKIVLNMFY